jgi:hypothetical protein
LPSKANPPSENILALEARTCQARTCRNIPFSSMKVLEQEQSCDNDRSHENIQTKRYPKNTLSTSSWTQRTNRSDNQHSEHARFAAEGSIELKKSSHKRTRSKDSRTRDGRFLSRPKAKTDGSTTKPNDGSSCKRLPKAAAGGTKATKQLPKDAPYSNGKVLEQGVIM